MKLTVIRPKSKAELDLCKNLDELGLLASVNSQPTEEQLKSIKASEIEADATCVCGHPWSMHTRPTDFSCTDAKKCGCTGYSTARR